MSVEEVSISRLSPMIIRERTAKSYTPKPRRKEFILKQQVRKQLSLIEEQTSLIEELSQKNAEAHTKCMKLQYELTSITKSLDKNVDFIVNACQSQELENLNLQKKIDERSKYHQRLQTLINLCSDYGIDINEIPGLDIEGINRYYDVNPPVSKGEPFDPTIKYLIDKYRIFGQCKTNRDFMQHCLAIKYEVERPDEMRLSFLQEKDPAERITFLQKYLNELRQSNSAVTARMAKELNILIDKRDELQRQIKQLKKTKRF